MKEIRNIIRAYDSIDHSMEKIALASVVNVEESSYRRIGARMLVRSNGVWVGGISGGCLEGDALKRSQKAIFSNNSSRVVYDTMEDDKNQIGVGLGCNGRIEVLFTPIDPSDPNNEIEQLKKIVAHDKPSVYLKIIDCDEGIELLGTQRAILEDRYNVDFAGIDSTHIQKAIDTARAKKKNIITEYVVDEKNVKVLVEFLRPETKLIIVGDNYDIMAMLGLAHTLGWKSTIIGKAKKLSKEVYKLAEKVLDYTEAESIAIHEYSAVLLMTHDYNHDKSMLPVFIRKKPGYIGMLGPKKRYLKMSKEFSDIDLNNIDFFYSPTGLEIGAESPEEIALSIAAEIVATFRKKSGGSLRLKEGTIHERE